MRFLLLLLLFSSTLTPLIVKGQIRINQTENSGRIDGYKYNLFAIKAEKIGGAEEVVCKIANGVLLHPRKKFTTHIDKKEYWFDNGQKFEHNHLFKTPGYFKKTDFIKKGEIDQYYMAVKIGRQWSRHYYDEIVASKDLSVGEEVGCEDCNFKKVMFDRDNTCSISIYYEIKPIYNGDAKAVTLAKKNSEDLIYSEENLLKADAEDIKTVDELRADNERILNEYTLLVKSIDDRLDIIEKLAQKHNKFQSTQQTLIEAYDNYSSTIEEISKANQEKLDIKSRLYNPKLDQLRPIHEVTKSFDNYLKSVQALIKENNTESTRARKIKELNNKHLNKASKVVTEYKGYLQKVKTIPEVNSTDKKETSIASSSPINTEEDLENNKEAEAKEEVVISQTVMKRKIAKNLEKKKKEKKEKGKGWKIWKRKKKVKTITEVSKEKVPEIVEKPVKVETVVSADSKVEKVEKPEMVTQEEKIVDDHEPSIKEMYNDEILSYHVLFTVLDTPNGEFEEVKSIGPLFRETFDESGSTRYLVGYSTTIEGARKLIDKVKALGFKVPIIAEYTKGSLNKYIHSPESNN